MRSESPIKPGAYTALALAPRDQSFQLHRSLRPRRGRAGDSRDFLCTRRSECDGDHRIVRHGIFCHLHALRAGLGWLSDRFSRWLIVGISVMLWSLASGGLGPRGDLWHSLVHSDPGGNWRRRLRPGRADHFGGSFSDRSPRTVLSVFFAAIPVGSALGYVLGGLINCSTSDGAGHFTSSPRPGLLLGLLSFTQRDPRGRGSQREQQARPTWDDYLMLFRTRSYVINCARRRR